MSTYQDHDQAQTSTGTAKKSSRHANAKVPHWIVQMNQDFAFVIIGGRQKIATFKQGKFDGFIAVEAFLNLVKSRRPSGITAGEAGNSWMQHEFRRTFHGVTFAPLTQCPAGTLNLWAGFNVSPKEGDIGPFLEFLHNIICGGSAELYEYLLAWLAHLVQKPYEKPGTAIVLRGGQGTGKSTFAEFISGLFGSSHAITLPSAANLSKNFNSHLAAKVFVVIEEAPITNRDANAIKQLITDPKMLCEPKGVDAFPVENYIHLLLCTNEEKAVHAQQDERRYVVVDVANVRKLDTKYFADLRSWYSKNSGLLLHYLQNYDHSKMNLYVAPKTTGLLDQKIASLSLIDRAIYNMLINEDVGYSKKWEGSHQRQNIVDQINEEYRHQYERKVTTAQVGRRLASLFPSLTIHRESSANRQWLWGFPPLSEARRAFENMLGQPIEWETLAAH